MVLKRKERGAFAELKPGSFMVVAMDNINVRASNALAVHGHTNLAFDGLAVQAVNPNTDYNFWKACRKTDKKRLEVRRPGKLSRSSFVSKMFPTSSDPDLTAYRWAAVGLAILHRRRLCCKDTANAQSFGQFYSTILRGLVVEKRGLFT